MRLMDESSKLEQRIKHKSNIIDEMFKTRKHVSFMDSNSFRITAIIPKGLSKLKGLYPARKKTAAYL